MIKLIVMFRPSNILQKYILLTYYYQKLIEKLHAPCLVDANQFSKYFAFIQIVSVMIQDCGKKNKECISSNSFGGILFIFMISKILSLKKQNLAVEAATGGSYDANILLTVEPKTLAGVNYIFSYSRFGKICNPHSQASQKISVIWFHTGFI